MNKNVAPEEQREARINVWVKGPMAAHLESVIGPKYLNMPENLSGHASGPFAFI